MMAGDDQSTTETRLRHKLADMLTASERVAIMRIVEAYAERLEHAVRDDERGTYGPGHSWEDDRALIDAWARVARLLSLAAEPGI